MMLVYCVVALALVGFLLYKSTHASRFVLDPSETDPDTAVLDPEQADLQRIIDEYDEYCNPACDRYCGCGQ